MKELDARLERVERALAAAYRRELDAPSVPPEADVGRIMGRVRAAARERAGAVAGDMRFMWRFLSAGMVAAAVLLAVAVKDMAPDAAPAGGTDDTIVVVVNPALPL